jgi:hypothetical protein
MVDGSFCSRRLSVPACATRLVDWLACGVLVHVHRQRERESWPGLAWLWLVLMDDRSFATSTSTILYERCMQVVGGKFKLVNRVLLHIYSN